MKTINIHKYSPIADAEAESVTIVIDTAVPDLPAGGDWEQHARTYFEEQAATLADALFETLPGGTLDRLLAEFLRRKAALFVVPSWRAVDVPRQGGES